MLRSAEQRAAVLRLPFRTRPRSPDIDGDERALCLKSAVPQVCRAPCSHVCLASRPASLGKFPPVTGAACSLTWAAVRGSLRAHRHAEDPAVFTRDPHVSRRSVEDMGLHHVHPQEAPPDGENEFGFEADTSVTNHHINDLSCVYQAFFGELSSLSVCSPVAFLHHMHRVLSLTSLFIVCRLTYTFLTDLSVVNIPVLSLYVIYVKVKSIIYNAGVVFGTQSVAL